MSTFDIELDKAEYNAGETVTGKLITSAGRDLQLVDLKLSAFGAEFIIVSGEPKSLQLLRLQLNQVSDSNFEEFNVLFSKDLSRFLYSALEKKSPSLTSRTRIKIPKGKRAIPFEFTIPPDALQSYQGKHVYIVYKVNVGAGQLELNRNFSKCSMFRVRNPRSSAEVDDKATILQDDDPKADLPPTESEAHVTFDLKGKAKFSQGEAIDGMLVLKNLNAKDVRKIRLSLVGIEYATAYAKTIGFKKKTIIEQYDQNIASSKLKDGMESINFKFHISPEAQMSYVGRHSEFYWELTAKLDVARGRDLICERRVQIVSK